MSRADDEHGFSAAITSARRPRAMMNPLRGARSGPSVFYLGPFDDKAAALARRTEELPLTLCYFWSTEQLNRQALWNFSLGLVAIEEWPRLVNMANAWVKERLAETPLYILQTHADQRVGVESHFATYVRGVLPFEASMVSVAAEIMAALHDLEQQDSQVTARPLQAKPGALTPAPSDFKASEDSFALIDENNTFSQLLCKAAQAYGVQVDLYSNIRHYRNAGSLSYDVFILDYNLGTLLGLDEKNIVKGLSEVFGEVPLLLLVHERPLDMWAGKAFMRKISKDFNMERIMDCALKLRREFINVA